MYLAGIENLYPFLSQISIFFYIVLSYRFEQRRDGTITIIVTTTTIISYYPIIYFNYWTWTIFLCVNTISKENTNSKSTIRTIGKVRGALYLLINEPSVANPVCFPTCSRCEEKGPKAEIEKVKTSKKNNTLDSKQH